MQYKQHHVLSYCALCGHSSNNIYIIELYYRLVRKIIKNIDVLFLPSLHPMYFKSLRIIKNNDFKMWELFKKSVPTFSITIIKNSLFLSGLITNFYYKKNIRASVRTYEKIWNKNRKVIFERFEQIFDMDLPFKAKAYVCITPLYVRNIEDKSFLLPTNASEKRILEIIIHELSHFYFFEGCFKIGISEKRGWKLSEQIVPYILESFFADICSISVPYVEEPTEKVKYYIESWLNGKIVFIDFLKKVLKKDDR